MASTPFLLSILAFLVLLSSASFLVTANAASFVLPVVKDIAVSQYYTSFLVGTPPKTRVLLVLDLGNRWSWFACDIYGYNSSSTYRPVLYGTPKCNAYGDGSGVGCTLPVPKPSCTNDTCGSVAYTPWSDGLYSGGIIEDVISLYKQGPNSASLVQTSLSTFPFTCADKGPLKGLSGHTKGVVTLARAPIALHAQISSVFKIPRKFALCLPSINSGYNGAIYFGGGPYHFPSTSPIDLSKSLVTTPLVINPNSTAPIYSEGDPSIEYFVNVRSIKIDGTPIRFASSLLSFGKDGVGGTKISTMDPYTVLHSAIYKSLVDVFITKAATMKIARVAPVAPFGACFDAKTIPTTKFGPNVPIIDIIFDNKSPVLHNKNARWRIYGANSIVKASDSVSCLAFVDGGSSPRTSIVIGGKQMEDNLVEFDVGASKIGVTSSLLRMGTTCSQFRGI